MQQFRQILDNKYTRLALLTLGLGTLFLIALQITLAVTGLSEFPMILTALVSYLAAGIVVYKYLSFRVF